MATKRLISAAGAKIPEPVLAQAVATYQTFGDRNGVAARFNISKRTLSAAVARAKADEEFGALVAEKQEELELRAEDWVDDAVEFMRSGLGKLRRLVNAAEPTQIRAVAGALKVVGEILTVHKALSKPPGPEVAKRPRKDKETPASSEDGPVSSTDLN